MLNPIICNHIGFPTNAPKSFFISASDAETDTFEVIGIFDTLHTKCFNGKMLRRTGVNGEEYFEGRFDDLTKEGDYYITVGSKRGRCFVIYDKAYSNSIRIMLSYFTYQRCGDPLGWGESCHLDDGHLHETGERVDLTGGYHQSCDLRKSTSGISIGVYGMIRSAMLDDTTWGKQLFRDEIIHACDYYVKSIQSNGVMYNTLGYPFGWEGREFFKSAPPASGQWNATRCLALASVLIPEKREIYLKTALRSYQYLTSADRSDERYRHPTENPQGMDGEHFFLKIYKDSLADKAHRVCCAADMFRATGDQGFLDEVKKAEEYDPIDMLELCGGSPYAWAPAGIIAFIEAYEILGICKDKIEKIASLLAKYAKNDVWGRCIRIYNDKTLDEPSNTWDCKPGAKKRDTIKGLRPLDDHEGYYYTFGSKYAPNLDTLTAVFLQKAGNILKNSLYRELAQRSADYLMGCNPMDGSHIECVGYNQPERGVFGQFFPSTPQIPGGIGIGFSVDDRRCEYDMPCVGNAMWLFSEINSNAIKKSVAK